MATDYIMTTYFGDLFKINHSDNDALLIFENYLCYRALLDMLSLRASNWERLVQFLFHYITNLTIDEECKRRLNFVQYAGLLRAGILQPTQKTFIDVLNFLTKNEELYSDKKMYNEILSDLASAVVCYLLVEKDKKKAQELYDEYECSKEVKELLEAFPELTDVQKESMGEKHPHSVLVRLLEHLRKLVMKMQPPVLVQMLDEYQCAQRKVCTEELSPVPSNVPSNQVPSLCVEGTKRSVAIGSSDNVLPAQQSNTTCKDAASSSSKHTAKVQTRKRKIFPEAADDLSSPKRPVPTTNKPAVTSSSSEIVDGSLDLANSPLAPKKSKPLPQNNPLPRNKSPPRNKLPSKNNVDQANSPLAPKNNSPPQNKPLLRNKSPPKNKSPFQSKIPLKDKSPLPLKNSQSKDNSPAPKSTELNIKTIALRSKSTPTKPLAATSSPLVRQSPRKSTQRGSQRVVVTANDGASASSQKRPSPPARRTLRDLKVIETEIQTWSSSEDEEIPSLPVGRKVLHRSRQSLEVKKKKGVQFKVSSCKRPWTGGESEQLIRGVQKLGVGKWKEILLHFRFAPYRDNVSLKDRWRTMVNNREVPDNFLKSR